MTDVDIELGGQPVGELVRTSPRGVERAGFRYAEEWLSSDYTFAIDPELFLDTRLTYPARGGLFGCFTDAAPDRWGRQLMQRRERHRARTEQRPVRSLSELDYVLGVSDISRLGALRFRVGGRFVADTEGVPPLTRIRALVASAHLELMGVRPKVVRTALDVADSPGVVPSV